jgi:hypothetical protein
MDRDTEPSAVACNLAEADYKERLAWIDELNTSALRDYRRDGPRIELTYDPAATPRVREFVRREQECCPFLAFNIRDEYDAVVVAIEAPENAGKAADMLFAPYTATRRSGEA